MGPSIDPPPRRSCLAPVVSILAFTTAVVLFGAGLSLDSGVRVPATGAVIVETRFVSRFVPQTVIVVATETASPLDFTQTALARSYELTATVIAGLPTRKPTVFVTRTPTKAATTTLDDDERGAESDVSRGTETAH